MGTRGTDGHVASETKTLVADIEQTRDHLADTIDALVDRAHPKSIMRRTVANLKAKFVDETGSPRLETIVPVVGVAAGLIAAGVVIRKLTS